MFRKKPDFEAFERIIVETHERQPIRILSRVRVSIERGRPYGGDDWGLSPGRPGELLPRAPTDPRPRVSAVTVQMAPPREVMAATVWVVMAAAAVTAAAATAAGSTTWQPAS